MSIFQSQSKLDQKRVAVFELESALHAIDSQLAVLADELIVTEGKTISGLLAALSGSKQRQVDRIHALQNELEQRRDEMHRKLTALNEQVVLINSNTTATGKPTSDALMTPDATPVPPAGPSSAQEQIKRIEAAMAACDEARKDLLSEMETAGSLGRCRVGEAGKVLKMIGGQVRKGVAEECAERVRQSLRRLHRRLVAAAEAQPKDHEIHFMCDEVSRLAGTFSGRDLTSKLGGEDSGTWLHDRLQTVNMLLEQDLSSAKLHANDPHRSSDEILGPLPIPPASLDGDAVQVAPTTQE